MPITKGSLLERYLTSVHETAYDEQWQLPGPTLLRKAAETEQQQQMPELGKHGLRGKLLVFTAFLRQE